VHERAPSFAPFFRPVAPAPPSQRVAPAAHARARRVAPALVACVVSRQLSDCNANGELTEGLILAHFCQAYLSAEFAPICPRTGMPRLLKLKDWPCDAHFCAKLPAAYFHDLMQARAARCVCACWRGLGAGGAAERPLRRRLDRNGVRTSTAYF